MLLIKHLCIHGICQNINLKMHFQWLSFYTGHFAPLEQIDIAFSIYFVLFIIYVQPYDCWPLWKVSSSFLHWMVSFQNLNCRNLMSVSLIIKMPNKHIYIYLLRY